MNRRTARSRTTPVSVRRVTPFLWFDDEAERAARFYVSLFRNSRICDQARVADPEHPRNRRPLMVTFELAGQRFIALNGGPGHPPTEAFSIYVDCPSQAAVDRLWSRLGRGGREIACGWLRDRYGIAWQIIPSRLPELLGDPDPGRARRAFEAMMRMKKIEVRLLERAADGN